MDLAHLDRIGLLGWPGGGGDGPRAAACRGEAAGAVDAAVADVAELSGDRGSALDEEEPLFVMETSAGEKLVVPCLLRNDFFAARFEVTGLAPCFAVELSPLGPCGALGHDVAADGLDGVAAYRIAAAIGRLDGVPLRDFLRARPEAARDVPSVEALTDVFRAIASSGSRASLAEGLADTKEAACCYFDALCDAVRPTAEAFRAVVEVTEVLPSIFCVAARSSFVLGKMFLRMQEYYECPSERFRRQRFTLEDYKAWCRDGEGAFRYYVTWPGFNLPSWVLQDARDGALGPLEPWEQALLATVEGRPSPFYVVGTSDADPLTLRHELAHGLYTTNAEYKAAVTAALAQLSGAEQEGIRRRLIDMGYADDDEIIADETQAYMSEGNGLGCSRQDVLSELAEVFERFGRGCCA